MGKQQAAIAVQQNCSEQGNISAQELHTKSGFGSAGAETQTGESKTAEAWKPVGITQLLCRSQPQQLGVHPQIHILLAFEQ